MILCDGRWKTLDRFSECEIDSLGVPIGPRTKQMCADIRRREEKLGRRLSLDEFTDFTECWTSGYLSGLENVSDHG
jgi:hypothetical protein